MNCLLKALKQGVIGIGALILFGSVYFGYMFVCEKIGGMVGVGIGLGLLFFGVIVGCSYLECKDCSEPESGLNE